MKPDLPRYIRQWAVAPLDANGAAVALGISRRTLDDVLRDHREFEWRGRKRVFYPEHIEQLRRIMDECGSGSSGKTDGHISTGPVLTGGASGALSKLVTLSAQRKPGRMKKRASGR